MTVIGWAVVMIIVTLLGMLIMTLKATVGGCAIGLRRRALGGPLT
jgi:hypothetical protein